MRSLGTLALVATVLALTPAAARAQEDNPAELTGTWKRDGEVPRMIRLDLDPQTGELVGKMLNPPADEAGHPYGVELHLKLVGKKLAGHATWSEDNPKKGAAGQPERLTVETTWELEIAAPGRLTGRTEWVDWDATGKVYDRGFEPHTFDRLPVVSLGSSAADKAAPAKVEPATPIDERALAGTWKTAQGWAVAFKPKDGGYVLERLKGEGRFPEGIALKNDGNVLRGVAAWPGSVETGVELALSAPGRLEGRAERVEGEKASEQRSWSPWALERLARIDGTLEATAAPGPLAAGAQATLAGLDLKRDDGLYLHLVSKEGGAYEGDLVSKTDGVRAKVTLAPSADNKLAGTATFKVDGLPVEAHWELAPQADGTVDARCEWIDWDPASKAALQRGLVARRFRALRKVG